jgi:hypothetical protein
VRLFLLHRTAWFSPPLDPCARVVAGMVMPDDSGEEGRELVYDRASASYQ